MIVAARGVTLLTTMEKGPRIIGYLASSRMSLSSNRHALQRVASLWSSSTGDRPSFSVFSAPSPATTAAASQGTESPLSTITTLDGTGTGDEGTGDEGTGKIAEEGRDGRTRKPSTRTQDIVRTVAKEHELTQKEARAIVHTIFRTIRHSLAKEKRPVTISDFGTFSTYESKATEVRSPITGETILVPAKERVRFKPYTSLKESVSGKL